MNTKHQDQKQVFAVDILIDELLEWCKNRCHKYEDRYGNVYGHPKWENFTFEHLNELLKKIRDSEYYKSLKNR